MSNSLKIAIIGAGPRGLALAERLGSEAKASGQTIDIHMFDPNERFGAGPNFHPEESDLSLLNLPVYDVELQNPDGENDNGFARYHAKNGGKDEAFPPRNKIGQWLEERFEKLGGSVKTVAAKVESIEKAEDGWTVSTQDGKGDTYSHVILAVAQPESNPDRAVARWQGHAEKTKAELTDAYPSKELGKAAAKWKGKKVAIRGFALSSLDVLRQLTLAQGGSFTEDGYKASGKEPEEIYIFSKDGLSMHPKPDGKELDAKYDLTEEEKAHFEEALHAAFASEPKDAPAVVFAALNAPATRILESFDAAPRSEAISTWLHNELKQPGSQNQGDLTEILAQSHGMAKGDATPDVGYVLGQIWRKLQDNLSNVFDSTDEIPDESRKSLIAFDEGFKRYSYGPPVETFAELRKLIDAGIVKLDFVDNPTLSMADDGWKLKSGDEEVVVDVLVNAVLPDGDLASVSDTAIAGLRDAGHLQANAVGGAKVSPRGEVLDSHGEPIEGLFLMGRLANGSVIGADTLKHCFGEGTNRIAARILGTDKNEEEAAA
jgi:uncharacterized NAD(P)/FAD-binding protein YdhS